MPFGMTDDGFVIKRLADIKAEMEIALRAQLGNGINLLPTSVLGQIVGVLSEREALIWELMQAVYDSQSPEMASGVSLDNVVSITGIKRLGATKGTGAGIAYGTVGTLIPAGSVVSVDGNADARFVTTDPITLGPGTDEEQLIEFSAVPDAGNWTIIFDGDETGTLGFGANAAAVQSALNALAALSGVVVAGDYTVGFTVTFSGADGEQDQPLLQIGTNTLEAAAVPVDVTITETVPGVLPNAAVNLEAESAGEINGYANTITVIETPVAGWDSFNNPTDVDPGKEIETDPELRLRREQTLATAGSTTVDAIRARLLEIDEVIEALVYENDTDAVDLAGRPPHSFEAVVLGGDDQEIVDTIWNQKAAGIATYGSDSGTAVDTMGYSHPVYFSRPTEIPIFVIVNISVDGSFPVGGEDAIKEAIAAYADDNFGIGDDVITTRLFCPINDVQGITDIEVLVGTSYPPVSDANIPIGDAEISVFDTANIEVNII